MQTNVIKPPTEIVNKNFQELLDKFHALLKNDAPKKSYEELKAETLTKVLTGHQISAITERCNNVLNNSYGSTSKELNSGYYSKK
jgi:hypothetical protein